jgi:hypothetical protein
MIDYKDWNRVHEFDLDTAAKLWYVSAKNVYISDVPPLEDNPYYHRLIAAIRNNQLKIEDVHLSMGGPAILTRGNLIQFFEDINEYIPIFLRSLEHHRLVNEGCRMKKRLISPLIEGKLNGNRGIKYWFARAVVCLWPKFHGS